MSYININKFPFNNIRKSQKSVIDAINGNIDDYKFIIMQLPVGFGKSPLAINICNSFKNGFIITATKQLQDQYMNDFSSTQSLTSIKGKANYKCNLNERLNCENGYCALDKKQLIDCKIHSMCTYFNLQEEAKHSQIFLTSYQYFLRALECSKWVKPRNVLIFDECHLLEEQIVTWAEIKLSPKELIQKYNIVSNCDLQEMVSISIPPTLPGLKENKQWIKNIMKLISNRRFEKYEEIKSILGITSNDPDNLTMEELDMISSSHKEYYELDKLYKKLDVFFKSSNSQDWLIEPYDDGLQLIPIDVAPIFNKYIKGMAIDKIIFMSGTILDIPGFRKLFGLKKEDTLFINAESEFNPHKSPIIYRPICKMNYKEINNNLDKIAKEVKLLLDEHPNEKGIIHAGNSIVSKYLLDNIKSDRLLVRHGEIINNHIIKAHKQSNKPTVLVSSSLSEGVDLKDDLSRFQIIIKMPFLSLANKRISEKIKYDNDWYFALMFKKLIQQCGRSTRNKDDYSITYILDNSFKYWINKYKVKGWFTRYFLNRIIWDSNNFNLNKFKKNNNINM